MKFKILIVLLWGIGVLGLADEGNHPKTTRVPISEAHQQKPQTHELQKWMHYQNRRQQLKGTHFEKLPSELQRLALALDYRLDQHFSKGRKLPDDNSPNDLEIYNDLELERIHKVQAQIRLIYVQVYEIIREAVSDSSVASPEVIKLLTNLLQHLEYLFQDRDNFAKNPPPVLYNLRTNQTIAAYCDSPELNLPDEEFLDEQNDQIVQLFDQYNMNHLHLVRKMVLLPGQSSPPKNHPTTSLPPKVTIRKLNNGNRNTFNQKDNNMNPRRLKKHVVETKVYTASPYDIPIEDRVREYERDYVVNIDTIQNFAEMFATIKADYAFAFKPVRKVNEKMNTGIYAGENEPTIEEFDEVVVACKSIVTKSNPHLSIVNQILTTFIEQQPNSKFFYKLYEHHELSDRIDQNRKGMAVSRSNHQEKIDQQIVPRLRKSYYQVVNLARHSEMLFNSFAYQTDMLRRSPSSEMMNSEEIRASLKELKRIVPILVSFADSFDSNFAQIVRSLKNLQSGNSELFDAGADLESHSNLLKLDFLRKQQEQQRSANSRGQQSSGSSGHSNWWQRLWGNARSGRRIFKQELLI